MSGLIDMGWGAWRLADPGLAPTRVSQAQAERLLSDLFGEQPEAGAAEVRFGDMLGDLAVFDAKGRTFVIAEDGGIMGQCADCGYSFDISAEAVEAMRGEDFELVCDGCSDKRLAREETAARGGG